jgi:hypothetical protein
VGFVVDKVAFWQVSLQVLQFSPVSIISPVFHTDSNIYHWCYIVLVIDSIIM